MILFCLLSSVLAAQEPTIRTTVPLVVAPTTVSDAAGKHIDGLTAADFLLFDNGKQREIQVDVSYLPISLVIAIQTSGISGPALAKIRRIGSMVEPLLVGERGDAAILTYGDEVRKLQDFTSDGSKLTAAMRRLRPRGKDGVAIDAVAEGVRMLGRKSEGRRRVMLLIGESRDRGSKAKLDEAASQAQLANVTIYTLSYSAMLTSLTERTPAPSSASNANVDIVAMIREPARLAKQNIAELFPKLTGGMTLSFVKENGLESAVEKIGEEIHNQYLLTFTPERGKDRDFHQILVRVKNNPDAVVRTRPGYWPRSSEP
jgi:VWFA-related protein